MKALLKKYVILLFIVFTFQGITLAADWNEIVDKHYIDMDSIQKTNWGGMVFWVKQLNPGTWQAINNKKVWYRMTRIELFCSSKSIRTQTMVNYDFNREVIDQSDNPSYKTENIVPESVGELYYDFICE